MNDEAREEVDSLLAIYGGDLVNVADAEGGGGGHTVTVTLDAGGAVHVVVHCPPGYPALPPVVEVVGADLSEEAVDALVCWRRLARSLLRRRCPTQSPSTRLTHSVSVACC
jgi:hypothetical protein